jgi:DNA-binding NarL/FixJ family response regulator
MTDKIQLVIVDDHPLFREGLIQTLSAEPDFEIVGGRARPTRRCGWPASCCPMWCC